MSDRRREGRAASKRQLRVGEALRHALAEILGRGAVHDPALDGVSVTVTEVEISPDLRKATAFVTPLGGGDQEAVIAGLNRSAKWLRGQVAKAIRLKYAPIIGFRLDQSFDHASHIDSLLRAPTVAHDLAQQADGPDTDRTNEDGA